MVAGCAPCPAAMSSLGMSSVRALLRPMARTTAQRASFWTSTPPVEPTPPAEAGMEIPWEQGRSTYRKLLRACRNYPSIKRDGIYADIRLDFKDHASITDPKKILRFRSQALSGLEGLKHFGDVAKDPSADWETGPIKHPDPRDPKAAGTRR